MTTYVSVFAVILSLAAVSAAADKPTVPYRTVRLLGLYCADPQEGTDRIIIRTNGRRTLVHDLHMRKGQYWDFGSDGARNGTTTIRVPRYLPKWQFFLTEMDEKIWPGDGKDDHLGDAFVDLNKNGIQGLKIEGKGYSYTLYVQVLE